MGNITLELDSNFVAPSSRVRDEQQTKKCEFLIGNRNLMKMTHTPKSSVIIIMAGPKEGHGHRQKKKKELHIPVNMAEDREDDTPFPFRRL